MATPAKGQLKEEKERRLTRVWRSLTGWIYRRPPRYEEPYSENLIAVYHSLIIQDDALIKARVAELESSSTTPAEACELELLNLHLAPAESIPFLLAELRSRRTALGEEELKPSAAPDNTAAQKAEAAELIAWVHRRYALQELFDAQKRWILFWMFFWFVVSVSILGTILVKALAKGILFEEMLAGVIGGYTSSFIRMYKTEPGKDLVASIQTLRNGVAGLIEKPLLGGIFAIVLHLLFLSHAITGGMFPLVTVQEMGDKTDVFTKFFYGTVEATSIDFAKLLLWCFIGGFVERFVPDVLDSMAEKASKSSGDLK
jgi:hypothetical protein